MNLTSSRKRRRPRTAQERRLAVEEGVKGLRHFWAAVFLLALLSTLAVAYYVNVESEIGPDTWTLVDAVYMAVLTITTIGFKEVHSLSDFGKVFTTGFAITGVLLAAWAVRSAASILVSQQLSVQAQRRRRLRALEAISDHYIVCGYGRMGLETVAQLRRRGHQVVVIEMDEAALERVGEDGIPSIEGNATDDESLRSAGIERARCLVAAVGTDEDNLFIVLSARLLNPKLHIVARAGREETVDKLRRAGANSVHSPYVGGGRDLAYAAMDPSVVHFLEQVLHHEELDVDIFTVLVPQGSPIVGKPMLGSGVMQEGGAMILGVIGADGNLHTNPRPDTAVNRGDKIIAIGTREQLAMLQRAVRG